MQKTDQDTVEALQLKAPGFSLEDLASVETSFENGDSSPRYLISMIEKKSGKICERKNGLFLRYGAFLKISSISKDQRT